MAHDTDLNEQRTRGRLDEDPLAAPCIIALDEFGVIGVEGADAVAFLQSQLTNDVAHLKGDELKLNGYCTAKGRLLATFHQWRIGDTVLLRLPRELLPSVVKRLSMFVLRAKARLTDASAQWSTHALIGDGVADRAQREGLTLPSRPWSGTLAGSVRIDRVPDANGHERYLLTAPTGTELPAWSRDFAAVPPALWWWSEIEAAIPTVFAATQEKFVPQMINFEVVGGVDFRKGCYPGQEVVARSQYLGKLKRRMQRGRVDSREATAGADVFHSDASQPVGAVVMAAPTPGGGAAVLFEVPLERIDAGNLHLGAPDGPRISVRSLPYEIIDPTA